MAFIHYKDLDVFKMAYQTAIEIHRGTENLPKPELFGGMGDQIRRSSKSVCANLAEGLGKNASQAELRRFLSLSLGSAEETRLWLMFCRDLGYVSPDDYTRWDATFLSIVKMLYSLMERRTGVQKKPA